MSIEAVSERSPASVRDYYRSASKEAGIKERYYSRTWADLEMERLWPKVWQFACRIEEIPSAGDYVEYVIGDQSVLLVRVGDTEIKAYLNACQHRGMRLKEGRGHSTEIRCPSHAWTWNLDGSNREVIEAQDFDQSAIAPNCLALPECQVEVWNGFVFINFDKEAEPLSQFLSPIPERLSSFAVDGMRCLLKRSTTIKCNWKLGYEGFIETYHAAGTHPQVLRYLDITDMVYEQFGPHGMHRVGPGRMGTPSPLLGDARPDREEVLVEMVAVNAEAGYYKPEEVELIVEAARSLPADVSIESFFGNIRRQQAEKEGMDWSGYTDYDLLVGPLFNLFPNITLPCNVGGMAPMRFRPNGDDPESCIYDIYFMASMPENVAPPFTEEFYPDWQDFAEWGSVLTQDYENLPKWQKGLHSKGFQGPIWGRPDGNVANFHRSLTNFIGQEA